VPPVQQVTTIGLDLAKDVFQIAGRSADGTLLFNRKLKRKAVLPTLARLPPCLVGMEACAGAHHWARAVAALGHRVKLMPPRQVKAFVNRGKTDANDAEAIAVAAPLDHVSSVPIKSEAQQCLLMQHKARQTLQKSRVLLINTIRAHMAELGVVDAKGDAGVERLLAALADGDAAALPAHARLALLPLAAVLAEVNSSIDKLTVLIGATFKCDETSRRLATVHGVGRIGATAFAATVADAAAFKSGRDFAASLGLTPRIEGTGGKVKLGAITKQGNGYLRSLLYLGAVSRLRAAQAQPHTADPWVLKLLAEKPYKTAAIALANKAARTIWALLVRGGSYVEQHRPVAPVASRALARQ
jgi:transposase